MSAVGDMTPRMSAMNDIHHPLLTSLARLCRERRRQHKITQAAVAERAGLSRQAIVEFEGVRAWPRDPKRIVAAYGDEPHALWRDAATSALEQEARS